MRKIIISAFLLFSLGVSAQKIQLPTPNLKVSSDNLFQVLKSRKSIRSFSAKEISDDMLSMILWAACGINRPDEKKITAPSAINAQDILVYVCRADGAYLYQPLEHSLLKVSQLDLRNAVAGNQSFAADAPISLVMVSDGAKFHHGNAEKMGMIDAGYVSENICLACTALGLVTVPRMSMDKETLKKELHLKDKQILILNNPIGYAK